jgi:hypothetical protein
MRTNVKFDAVSCFAEPVSMRRPPEIDIIRKAYELWELSGKPDGRDQEFYLKALQELQSVPGDMKSDQPEQGNRQRSTSERIFSTGND